MIMSAATPLHLNLMNMNAIEPKSSFNNRNNSSNNFDNANEFDAICKCANSDYFNESSQI